MNKLVLFDGNAIIHRAYHALPGDMTTRAGEPINAVYGLVSILLRVIQDTKPDYIAFAWDRPEPTFRNKMFEDYQAHRPEADKELISQFEKAQKVIRAMHIPSLDKKGFEADDILGTIAAKYHPELVEGSIDKVLIVTGDRDMLQLVDKKTKLYMPVKGLSDAKEFGKTETIERMGVPPEQIIDFKALVGDPSDNYKGVPGIGPKTAITLLEKYKTLNNIYKNLYEISDSVRKKLEENKDLAYQSQTLAKIVTDVDINFDLPAAGKFRVDSDQVLNLFLEYGFRTLTKRVKEVGRQMVDENQMSLI